MLLASYLHIDDFLLSVVLGELGGELLWKFERWPELDDVVINVVLMS